jgi:hypothetical protein
MAVDVQELLALPEAERRALHQLLGESLRADGGFEMTEELWQSLEEAREEYERDPSKAVPALEAMMRLRERRGF